MGLAEQATGDMLTSMMDDEEAREAIEAAIVQLAVSLLMAQAIARTLISD